MNKIIIILVLFCSCLFDAKGLSSEIKYDTKYEEHNIESISRSLSFTNLPEEMLIEIFSYLINLNKEIPKTKKVIKAFFYINKKFNALISKYFTNNYNFTKKMLDSAIKDSFFHYGMAELKAIRMWPTSLAQQWIKSAINLDQTLLYELKQHNLYDSELLLKLGADPNVQYNVIENVLIKYTRKGYQDIVKLLLKSGANPDTKDWYKNTAIIWATRYKNRYILALLLKFKGDPNIPDKHGYTALHKACYNNDKDTARLLLKYNANPNLQCIYGSTPLICCAMQDKTELADLLIKFKANTDLNVDIKDKDNKSAIEYAYEQRNRYIVNLLLQAGADSCEINNSICYYYCILI